MKTDGRWTYTWDAENRLIQMTVNTAAGPQYQLSFAYDFQGRRIQKVTALYTGSSYVTQSIISFLYDVWNPIVSLSSPLTPVNTFMWGNDVSGSAQGAGGVGGLLEVSYSGTATTNCFTAFDGNGNLAALVNAADGTLVANYEYGPFGEVIRQTGPMAKANPFRFSTKYQDDESDLLYYGYRYYKASTGTWPNRDPLEEMGGMNLFAFVMNDPITKVDLLGFDGVNTVYTATCDFCGKGPKFDGTTKTTTEHQKHGYDSLPQNNNQWFHSPGNIGITIWKGHIPFSGHNIVTLETDVVNGTCGVPSNNWSLTGFRVTDWGTWGGTVQIECKYHCNLNSKRTSNAPGTGTTSTPPGSGDGDDD